MITPLQVENSSPAVFGVRDFQRRFDPLRARHAVQDAGFIVGQLA